jgi:hypothetical protein
MDDNRTDNTITSITTIELPIAIDNHDGVRINFSGIGINNIQIVDDYRPNNLPEHQHEEMD